MDFTEITKRLKESDVWDYIDYAFVLEDTMSYCKSHKDIKKQQYNNIFGHDIFSKKLLTAELTRLEAEKG